MLYYNNNLFLIEEGKPMKNLEKLFIDDKEIYDAIEAEKKDKMKE